MTQFDAAFGFFKVLLYLGQIFYSLLKLLLALGVQVRVSQFQRDGVALVVELLPGVLGVLTVSHRCLEGFNERVHPAYEILAAEQRVDDEHFASLELHFEQFQGGVEIRELNVQRLQLARSPSYSCSKCRSVLLS